MIIPKKSLGQNFLIDKNICNKIINLISIKNKIVIEIGPGMGQLTDQILLNKPKKLILIEKDKKLFEILKLKYKKKKNIEIINTDALNFNYNIYKNINIISNLPYNISKDIIFNLLMCYKNINELVVMVQKEMAEKFNYNLNKKNNKYKFLMSIYAHYKIMFNISNKVFYPKPKIDSTVIKLMPFKNNINIDKLNNFIKLIFKNKRKKIKNNINFNKSNNKVLKLINYRVEDLNNKELLYLFNKF